ncbi:uncharacterized protein F4807DRAFT_361876 [Annulohypoxylon truncatum]|uniref:uncharacterized protein n=1 Tax=Annulohypoxylon truncatum TaxID=327061 RepID=UPI002008DF70|nr:uncharacterized protein F4807DRAFT_361876 [Annulohypoxylon truncatum]KAI1212190.1 hypothetical protein F4807DRAFT_361876 [Annulohypoxylon truncatum]
MSTSSEYAGWRLVVFISMFTPLQTAAVGLRFYARSLTRSSYGLDDWLVSGALLGQFIATGLAIGSVRQGAVGYHAGYLEITNPELITVFLKYLVAISAWYFATIWPSKLAICVLYRRLFPQRIVLVILCVTAGIFICTSIVSLIVDLAACRPFAAQWASASVQATQCLNKESLFIWSSLPNIITDAIMLSVPLPIVWRLHASTHLKAALTVTFAVGSIGLIASILRFKAFHSTNSFTDATYNAVELIIWTIAEPGIYLISACMLVYRPVLEKLYARYSRSRGKLTSASTGQGAQASGDSYKLGRIMDKSTDTRVSRRTNGFERLWEDENDSQIISRADCQLPQPVYSTSNQRVDEQSNGITRTTVIHQSWN